VREIERGDPVEEHAAQQKKMIIIHMMFRNG
jgi:hypothetical protein